MKFPTNSLIFSIKYRSSKECSQCNLIDHKRNGEMKGTQACVPKESYEYMQYASHREKKLIKCPTNKAEIVGDSRAPSKNSNYNCPKDFRLLLTGKKLRLLSLYKKVEGMGQSSSSFCIQQCLILNIRERECINRPNINK